ALPGAARLVLGGPGAARRPADLRLGRQRARPCRSYLQAGFSPRGPHPDPPRPAGARGRGIARGAAPGRRPAAGLHAGRAAPVEARPVSRTRCNPRLLAVLPRPVYRRARSRRTALRLAAILLALAAAM